MIPTTTIVLDKFFNPIPPEITPMIKDLYDCFCRISWTSYPFVWHSTCSQIGFINKSIRLYKHSTCYRFGLTHYKVESLQLSFPGLSFISPPTLTYLCLYSGKINSLTQFLLLDLIFKTSLLMMVMVFPLSPFLANNWKMIVNFIIEPIRNMSLACCRGLFLQNDLLAAFADCKRLCYQYSALFFWTLDNNI